MSEAKYYVLCDYECSDGFFVTGEHAEPRAFDTEAEAVTEAKDYSSPSLVLQAVARVTEVTKHKVEKIK